MQKVLVKVTILLTITVFPLVSSTHCFGKDYNRDEWQPFRGTFLAASDINNPEAAADEVCKKICSYYTEKSAQTKKAEISPDYATKWECYCQ